MPSSFYMQSQKEVRKLQNDIYVLNSSNVCCFMESWNALGITCSRLISYTGICTTIGWQGQYHPSLVTWVDWTTCKGFPSLITITCCSLMNARTRVPKYVWLIYLSILVLYRHLFSTDGGSSILFGIPILWFCAHGNLVISSPWIITRV